MHNNLNFTLIQAKIMVDEYTNGAKVLLHTNMGT